MTLTHRVELHTLRYGGKKRKKKNISESFSQNGYFRTYDPENFKTFSVYISSVNSWQRPKQNASEFSLRTFTDGECMWFSPKDSLDMSVIFPLYSHIS